MEFGRGGAYVPARIALQGRIHRSRPCTMRIFLVWKHRCVPARVALQGRIHRSSTRTMRDTQTFFGMETPPCGCSGGHTGTAPTASFGWIARGRLMSFGGLRVDGILFVWDAWKNMMETGRGGAYVPARVAPQGRIHR